MCRVEAEFNSLEDKVAQFVGLCERLRAENITLRQQLVAAQNDPGPLADHVRAILHPLLDAQLDADLASAMPLFAAFARNMVGR